MHLEPGIYDLKRAKSLGPSNASQTALSIFAIREERIVRATLKHSNSN